VPVEVERVAADRWEHGSSLDLSLESGVAQVPWTGRSESLWGSGRDAMRGLLAWGRAEHGWRRLLVPSYYCQEVVEALQIEIAVATYDLRPTTPRIDPVDVRDGDVVLVVALFGARPGVQVPDGAVVLEDHSHDLLAPWAIGSDAHYAIASLRKTLPLPDGGVTWSPRGLDGPPERPMTPEHGAVALDRLSAMILKRQYLAGASIRKEAFRKIAARAEARIGRGAVSGISAYSRSRLSTLPIEAWREARAANLEAFRGAFGGAPGVHILDAPFAVTLVFDDPARRDAVRAGLLHRRIYGTILWPQEDPVIPIGAADLDLSRRILSIHADQRYTPADMVRVAGAVRRVLAG
jgi:hypothetical protein